MSARRPRQGATPEARDIRGAAELAVLVRELEHTAPACADDDRYVSEPDELLPGALDLMADICRACPLRAPCGDYGKRGRPAGGFWAGRHYPASEKAPANAALSPVDAS
ncbi:hypothetical protein [Microbacterium hominis]|uniref:4Fe-4S Wbl-type domain-containing protein n=1 Tax=Microbacterium hominis TaxID=162426 RepID=A0A0B4DST8_9MICO|nr:hypothetical protein [Microbacterium hominis]KIC57308.1 hypothetical protein RM52_09775 [Microbacterium hominis]